jgi:hypothetical protein
MRARGLHPEIESFVIFFIPIARLGQAQKTMLVHLDGQAQGQRRSLALGKTRAHDTRV